MKYTATSFVDSLDENTKNEIRKELEEIGISSEDIERGMGGRICDLEDTVVTWKYIDLANEYVDAVDRRKSVNSRLFVDEGWYVFTVDELEESYHELKADGETEEETFADYLANCTSKNGTLTEIK